MLDCETLIDRDGPLDNPKDVDFRFRPCSLCCQRRNAVLHLFPRPPGLP